MRKINYISNFSKNSKSGGWGGVNHAIYTGLTNMYDVNYGRGINPGQDRVSKVVSKVRRAVGLKGAYHFYSENRLQRIASEYCSCKEERDLDFFLGSTPWLSCNPDVPYMAFLDLGFISYVTLYNNLNEFIPSDIERICYREAVWLENAEAVFFTSKWALDEVKEKYGLNGDNFHAVGVSAYADIPEDDMYRGEPLFIFVATDFVRKGGDLCIEAFQYVRQNIPEARLILIGDNPGDASKLKNGVEHLGFLRKENPEEASRLNDYFSRAACQLLPTKGDATPTCIIELGYFGCPTIASNAYGIPGMIQNGKTGCLVDFPVSPRDLANKMISLLHDQRKYMDMRSTTRKFYCSKFTWPTVIQRIIPHIDSLSF